MRPLRSFARMVTDRDVFIAVEFDEQPIGDRVRHRDFDCAWRLHQEYAGVQISEMSIEGTPETIYRPAAAALGPVVLIAHGFAGSGQAHAVLRADLRAQRLHRRDLRFPRPRAQSEAADRRSHRDRRRDARAGRTRPPKVAAAARGLGDGRLAVLGHSMASDIVVRFAESDPEVAATIAVSMFSPAVTATSPRNLLVIDGDWEGFLKAEGAARGRPRDAPNAARAGVTYGDPAAGTGRRVAFSPHVEHAACCSARTAMREAVDWLDRDVRRQRERRRRSSTRAGPGSCCCSPASVALRAPAVALLPRGRDAAGRRRAWLAAALAAAGCPDDRDAAAVARSADAFPARSGRRLSRGAFRGLWPDRGAVPDRRRAAERPLAARRATPRALAVAALAVIGLRLRRAGLADRQLRHVVRSRARTRSCSWRPCSSARCSISSPTNG